MASYYEYHLERANSHFRDNGAIRNNHVRVRAGVRVQRDDETAMPRKLASRASLLSSARMHFHPAVMRIVFLLEHNALEMAWWIDNRLSAS
jgi:hypothetical protein